MELKEQLEKKVCRKVLWFFSTGSTVTLEE